MPGREQQKPERKSFSNGNGPAVITLPLEGHVTQPEHWWWR